MSRLKTREKYGGHAESMTRILDLGKPCDGSTTRIISSQVFFHGQVSREHVSRTQEIHALCL